MMITICGYFVLIFGFKRVNKKLLTFSFCSFCVQFLFLWFIFLINLLFSVHNRILSLVFLILSFFGKVSCVCVLSSLTASTYLKKVGEGGAEDVGAPFSFSPG